MRISSIRRLGLLICLLTAASGCSIKLAYNNLDRLVLWQVGDYVRLDREQKAYLRQEVDTLLYWHRRNHLPLYADYMRTLAVTLTDAPQVSHIDAMFEQFLAWGEEVEQRVLPPTIHVLQSLSEKQMAGLPEAFTQNNAEIAESEASGSVADHQAQWAEDFEDAIERFTGRLNKSQRDYIALRAQAYEPERLLWIDYRERWQADLLKLLEKRAEPTFPAAFRALVAAREDYYDETLSRVFDANIELSQSVMVDLFAGLTERQAERLVDRLTKLAEDFEELSVQDQRREA